MSYLVKIATTECEEKSTEETERMKLPDWDEVPEYGIEALISTIDDQSDLIAAIRREARRQEHIRDRDIKYE